MHVPQNVGLSADSRSCMIDSAYMCHSQCRVFLSIAALWLHRGDRISELATVASCWMTWYAQEVRHRWINVHTATGENITAGRLKLLASSVPVSPQADTTAIGRNHGHRACYGSTGSTRLNVWCFSMCMDSTTKLDIVMYLHTVAHRRWRITPGWWEQEKRGSCGGEVPRRVGRRVWRPLGYLRCWRHLSTARL